MTAQRHLAADARTARRVAALVVVLVAVQVAALAGCPDPPGAPCDDAAACDEGVCVAGVCTVQPCNGDSDCPGDAVCGNGTCVARAADVDGGARTDAGRDAEVDGGATVDGGANTDGGAGDPEDGGAPLRDGGTALDAGFDDAGAGGPDDGGASTLDGGAGLDDAGRDGGAPHLDGDAGLDAGFAGSDAGLPVDGGGLCYGLPPICPGPETPVVFVTVAQGGATLASRVDTAADGTLIVVEDGVYDARLQLDRAASVSLVAEGGPVTIARDIGDAVDVKSGGRLFIQGFTFTGTASPILRVEGTGSQLHLVGCTVTGTNDGVRNRAGGTLVLDRCDIRDNGGTGLVLEGPAVVRNTFIVGNGSGVGIGVNGLAIDLSFTTIAGNGAAFGDLNTCPTFLGVIVADNGSDAACLPGTGICAVATGAFGFVDASSGDYHLTAGSGFIDQIVDDLGESSGEDVEGDARPLRSGYDCGADEVPP